MTAPSPESNLIGQLAEEWRDRLRRGERPDLSEYTQKYPELAGEIRDLFPAIAMMEDLKPATGEVSSAGSGPGLTVAGQALERLGDFRILREVGRGGMGIVYEAEQESLGRRVALKILPAPTLMDPDKKKRFQREARATARLHHTNIVPVYGVGEHEGMQYYVMQFIQGLGLDEVLAELRNLRQHRTNSQATRTQTGVGHQGTATWPGPAPAPRQDFSAADVARSLFTGRFVAPGAAAVGEGSDVAETLTAPAVPILPAALEPFKPRLASSSGVSRSAGRGAGSSSEVFLPGQVGQASLSDSGRHYWLSVARIGIQVAEALEYANSQGVIHRDIKPSNLLLDTQGTVWVTDFGLAKATADGDNLTHTGDIVGTLRYMAPERFKGQSDARGDIYSLGLTLYELLVQRPAFDERDRSKLIHRVTHEEPPHPRKLNAAIPRDLETVVLKAIEREPARRYQTAGGLAEDLKRFLEDKPVKARRVTPAERLWRWCRRNPALAAATGLAAVGLVAVTILSVAFTISTSRAQQRTERALDQAERLADNLAVEKKNLAAEKKRTEEALGRSQLLAGNLAVEKKRAEDQTRRAEDQTRQTRDALAQTKRLSAKLLVERGQGLIERQSPAAGMLWLARGLEMAPADDADLQRVARTALAGLRSEMPMLRALFGHDEAVTSAVFSPDARLVLTASADKTARLWDARTGKPVGGPLEHDERVTAAVFSPDGQRVLTGSADKTARLWDVRTGKAVLKPLEHPDAVVAVAFSPDGATLATTCADQKARLWKAATGQPLGPPRETFTKIGRVLFSPDGKMLLTGFPGKAVQRWDAATGRALGAPLLHAQSVWGAAFSPDGKTILTGAFDKKARRWDAATGKPLGAALDHSDWLVPVAYRPDGQVMLTATRDGVAHLWDAATGRAVGQAMTHGSLIWTAEFSPDGRTVLTASIDHSARLWDADTGRPLGGPLPHPDAVLEAAFSPDGRTLLTRCQDKRVRVWALPAGRLLRAPLTHLDPVHVLAFSPDGRTIITGGGDYQHVPPRGEARLWDAATGRPIGPPLLHKSQVWAAAFSPDGKQVLTGGLDSTARLWDAATGKPLFDPMVHTNSIWGVAFRPDGKVCASWGAGKTARLWDTATGKELGQLPHPGAVDAAAFSPDGKTFVTGCHDHQVRRWDVGDPAKAKVLGKPLAHTNLIRAVAFSPDGRHVLTGSDDKTARLWDAKTGQPVGVALAHQAAVAWVAFSRDGRTVLTAGDRVVRLWDRATGRAVGIPLQHPEPLAAATFSPDGAAVLTGCRDGSARLWLARTGQLLGPPLAHQGAVTAAVFSPDGRQILTGSRDRTARLWEAPAPLEGEPGRLARWVEVNSSLELTPEGLVRLLDGADWHQRRAALDRLGGPPELTAAPGLGWHQRLAAEAAATGHWFAARWHLDQVIAVRPRDWFAHAQRSRVFLRLNQRERAAADCGRALELGPADTVRDWFGRQSPDYDPEATWETALWYFDQLVRLQPTDGLAHALRLKALVQLGRRDRADADYSRALDLGPRDEVLNRCRAYADECETKEQWETALWYLDRVLQAVPADWKLHERRGQACVHLGRLEEASAAYARATELDSTNISAWKGDAILRLRLGDPEGYRRVCGRFLGILKNQAASARNSGAWLCVLGPAARPNMTPVVTLATQAAGGGSTIPGYWHTLGVALYRAGRYQESLDRLELAMKLAGEGKFTYWIALAMTHHRLGHAAEARRWLDRSLAWIEASTPDRPQDPSLGYPIPWDVWMEAQLLRYEAEALIRGSPARADPDVRVAFARAHARMGRWDRAVADYDKAIAARPDDVVLRIERARGHRHLKQWDRAVADYGPAIDARPDDVALRVERAGCYQELKKPDEAAADFERVVALRRTAFEKAPALLSARQDLDRAYRDLAAAQLARGKPAEAAATLAHLGRLWTGNGARLFATAREVADAIPKVGKDPANPTAEEQDQRGRLADLAMGLLRQGARARHWNYGLLNTDPALAPLRPRDDFKALHAEQGRFGALPLPTGEIERLPGHGAKFAVMKVAVSADGRRALTAGTDKTACLWDLAAVKRLAHYQGFGGRLFGAAFSPDGRRALFTGEEPLIRLWDLETGQEVRRFTGSTGWNAHALFLPDGRRFLSCGRDHVLRLWDAQTGKEIRRFTGHTEAVWDLALSADGRRVLSAGYDHTARLWDVETGKELRRLEGHRDQVLAVAISPDGRRGLSGSKDGLLCLWDLETGGLLHRLEGHWNAVRGAAFSPDGRRILSGGLGHWLILWDADTGKALHSFAASNDALGVAFLPDGRRALVGDGAGGTASLWDLSEEAARARDAARVGRIEQAEKEYAAAVERRPDDPFLRLERGRFFARYKQWAKADADLARALKLRPADPDLLTEAARVHREHGEHLARLGKPREAAEWRRQARTLYEKALALQPDDAGRAAALADFLLAGAGSWTVIDPQSATSAGGATLTRLADGSFLAGGQNPKRDTYTIIVPTRGEKITAVLLETLPHDALPWRGPGRNRTGNFALSEFTARVRPATGKGPARPVRWRTAFGDHQAPAATHYAKRHMHIGLAIDGDPATAWEAWPYSALPRYAVFVPAEPLDGQTGSALEIRLSFAAYDFNNLGRFRLSVTADPAPLHWRMIRTSTTLDGWTKLGAARYALGDWPAARAALEKTIGLDGGTGHDRFLLALVHDRLGRPDDAGKWLDLGLAWLDKHPADDGVRELAVEALTAALARRPDDAGLLGRRAHLLARLGRPEEARADLRRAAGLRPREPRWPRRLAQLPPGLVAAWNFDYDLDGWQAGPQCLLKHTASALHVEVTGDYPRLTAPVAGPAGWLELTVRARVPAGRVVQVFWNKGSGTGYDLRRCQWFALPASGKDWADCKVYFHAAEPFTFLRLDPGGLRGTLEIDALTLRQIPGPPDDDVLRRQVTEALKLRPTDAFLLVSRGDLAVRRGRSDEAAADFAAALKLDAVSSLARHRVYVGLHRSAGEWPAALAHLDPLVKAEEGKPGEAALLVQRGHLLACLGRWKPAAADYARAVKLDSKDPYRWGLAVLLPLQTGDGSEYRRLGAALLERFAATATPAEAANLAIPFLITPKPAGDATLLGRLVERCASIPEKDVNHSRSLLVKGLAAYRAGRYKEAVGWLEKRRSGMPDPSWSRALAEAFLALAHQRLGQAGEAREALAAAVKGMDAMKARAQKGHPGGDWADWILTHLACREAEGLINGGTP